MFSAKKISLRSVTSYEENMESESDANASLVSFNESLLDQAQSEGFRSLGKLSKSPTLGRRSVSIARKTTKSITLQNTMNTIQENHLEYVDPTPTRLLESKQPSPRGFRGILDSTPAKESAEYATSP